MGGWNMLKFVNVVSGEEVEVRVKVGDEVAIVYTSGWLYLWDGRDIHSARGDACCLDVLPNGNSILRNMERHLPSDHLAILRRMMPGYEFGQFSWGMGAFHYPVTVVPTVADA
jgi:hypothetical protein